MDITSWFISLGHWNWFIAAAVLFTIELLAPGAFMVWLGLAAVVVGGVSLVVIWTWQVQVITFAVLAIALIPVWRSFAHKVDRSEPTFLNRRTQGYVGRVFTLETPIVGGVGTVRIDDTVWRVTGPDAPAGSKVKVARADGAQLLVEVS